MQAILFERTQDGIQPADPQTSVITPDIPYTTARTVAEAHGAAEEFLNRRERLGNTEVIVIVEEDFDEHQLDPMTKDEVRELIGDRKRCHFFKHPNSRVFLKLADVNATGIYELTASEIIVFDPAEDA